MMETRTAGGVLAFALVVLLSAGCATTSKHPQAGQYRAEARRAEADAKDAYQAKNWAAAARSFGQAADNYALIEDVSAEAVARHNEGHAARRAGLIEESVAAYGRALELNETRGDKNARATNLSGLLQAYRAQDKLDLAIETGEKALALAGGSKAVTSILQNDLALCLLQRGNAADEKRVIDMLTEAVRTQKSVGTGQTLATTYLTLGRAHVQYGQFEPAEMPLTKALTIFRRIENPAGIARAHELLAKMYLGRNDAGKAKPHLEQAREKFELLKDEKSLKRIEELAARLGQ